MTRTVKKWNKNQEYKIHTSSYSKAAAKSWQEPSRGADSREVVEQPKELLEGEQK